ncbi:MAG: hypothetical protein PHW13_11635 [Methylococcales bacterium]|nr:hypothetical protein [Methylococcales bacterium]
MTTYKTVYSGCTYGVRADFEDAGSPVEHLDADGEWLPTGRLTDDFGRNWKKALKCEISAGDPAHPENMERIDSAIRHAKSDDKEVKKIQRSVYIGIYSIGNRFVAIALDDENYGYGYHVLDDGDVIDMYDGSVCEQKDGRIVRRKKEYYGDTAESGAEDVIFFEDYEFGNGHETFESIAEKVILD